MDSWITIFSACGYFFGDRIRNQNGLRSIFQFWNRKLNFKTQIYFFVRVFGKESTQKKRRIFGHLPAQKHKRLYQNWSPRSGTESEKNDKKMLKSDPTFWGIFFFKKWVFIPKNTCFYVKNPPKFWITFWHFFLTFFQIPSRTSGINFDTIACVFELVDGQKKCLIF